jgi:glycosyl-4,4'-diaponeurosporenoate acyltransferase
MQIPVAALIAVNVLAWVVLHLGIAWLGTLLPRRLFDPARPWFRIHAWERSGRVYERLFRLRAWKDALPDGAALFRGGFRKARLTARRADYLAVFAAETCRGEAVHWTVLLSAALFFLWNPPWAGWIMVAYAIAANLPCILVQRYNRARLARAAKQRAISPAAG